MTQAQKDEITKISQGFAKGFEPDIPLNGSGWLIVDPLSSYLNFLKFENEVSQLPTNEDHGLILIIEFKDGSRFIPCGAEMKFIDEKAHNWMWI
jgi:hypothetical protein